LNGLPAQSTASTFNQLGQ